MKSRPGHALAELIVSLAFGSLICALAMRMLVDHGRHAATLARRIDTAEGTRVTWAVMAGELRYAMPQDVHAVTADSLRVRLFRGLATPCAPELFRYRGLRGPADKDSILGALSGNIAAVTSLRVEAGGCPVTAGESILRAPGHAPEPLLLFESGAYHLAQRALRYRLGAEGRQPLTTEFFRDARTSFRRMPGPAAVVIGIDLDLGHAEPTRFRIRSINDTK